MKFWSAGLRVGFTLAEVLIVVGIIGVIATVALPPLIEDVNQRVWNARSNDALAKLSEATNQMKVDDMLSGFANTDKFVDELQKYLKTMKRCNSDDLDKCFVSKFKADEDFIETKDLVDIKKIWSTSKDTNNKTVGLVIADGISMVMAFDQKCARLDPFSNTPRGTNGISATLGCLHMLYDTNGSSKPNTIGKDIKDYQISLSKGMACTPVRNTGFCLAKADVAIIPINTCDSNLVLDNGKKVSEYDTEGSGNNDCAINRWAGAKKTCEDAGMKLPSMAELAQLSTDVYNTPIGATQDKQSVIMDMVKAAEYQIPEDVHFWSSTQFTYGRMGSHRGFYDTRSNYGNSNKGATHPVARCIMPN